MIDDLKAYYQNRFDKYSSTPAAVQYSSRESQTRRFQILSEGIPKDGSIIDVGCGLADMLAYLRSADFDGEYLGLDLTPEFIDASRTQYELDLKSRFEEFDIQKDAMPDSYDYAVVSGVFNNRLSSVSNSEFLYSSITKMHQCAKRGIRFNALSSFVEYRDEELFYINPTEVFEYCRTQLSPYVTLKHDYVFTEAGYPYEFTIFVDKQPVE